MKTKKTRLSILLLCVMSVAAAAQDLSVRSIDLDEYASVGAPLTITGTVANNSTSAITGFDVFYIVNGDTSTTFHIDRTITAGSIAGYNHNVTYTPTAPGMLSITVVALNPGGDATAQPASLTVQLRVYDMTKAVPRNVLLEQFTTINCGYCPGGHDRIHQAVNGRNDVVWVCHHAGYGTDSLTIDASTTLLNLYGGSTWAPAMTLDRTRMDMSNPGCVMSVASSSATIRQQINQAAAVPTFVEIYIDVDIVTDGPDDRIVALAPRVSGRFTADMDIERPRLHLFLVEDSIMGRQSGATGLYRHDYVIRHCASSVWGDGAVITSTKEDSTFWKLYNVPIETKYRLSKCRLVAFVSSYNTADINARRVYNAVQTRDIRSTVGIDQVPMDNAVTVYPNPTDGELFVDCDNDIEELTLSDISGRKVMTRSQLSGRTHTLNVDGVPSGLYLLRISSASGTTVRKVVVRH